MKALILVVVALAVLALPSAALAGHVSDHVAPSSHISDY